MYRVQASRRMTTTQPTRALRPSVPVPVAASSPLSLPRASPSSSTSSTSFSSPPGPKGWVEPAPDVVDEVDPQQVHFVLHAPTVAAAVGAILTFTAGVLFWLDGELKDLKQEVRKFPDEAVYWPPPPLTLLLWRLTAKIDDKFRRLDTKIDHRTEMLRTDMLQMALHLNVPPRVREQDNNMSTTAESAKTTP